MRAKHPEMASDQAKMGLKWGVLASESTRNIEKRALASAAKLRPLGISAACYVWLLNDAALSFSKNLRKCPLNHYRLASTLASILGYSVENPNEQVKPDTYWVNGTSLDGASGSFSYSGATWLPQLKCGS